VGDPGYHNGLMLGIPGAAKYAVYPGVKKADMYERWSHIALVRSGAR